MTSDDVLAILAQNDLCLFRVMGKPGVPGKISIKRCDGTAVDNQDWSTFDVPEGMFLDFENRGLIMQALPPLSRCYRLTEEGRRRGLEGSDPVKAN
jgi:hypothetical protein